MVMIETNTLCSGIMYVMDGDAVAMYKITHNNYSVKCVCTVVARYGCTLLRTSKK